MATRPRKPSTMRSDVPALIRERHAVDDAHRAFVGFEFGFENQRAVAVFAPAAEVHSVRRKYRDGTLILETEFETDEGAVRIIDCMPLPNERWDVVRIVEGLRGRVAMRMELIVRFDYGSIVPWVRRSGDTLLATAGPDTLELHTVPRPRRGHENRCGVHVSKGERMPFSLNYRPSHEATRRQSTRSGR